MRRPEYRTCPLRASEPQTPVPRNPKGWCRPQYSWMEGEEARASSEEVGGEGGKLEDLSVQLESLRGVSDGDEELDDLVRTCRALRV